MIFFLNPVVTPGIMFATMVRESPCSSFARRSSLGRATTIAFSSFVTVNGSEIVTESEPFGPFTETALPFTFTSTPDGIATGIFPIRDIAITKRKRELLRLRLSDLLVDR